MKKTITENERLQIIGLATLAHKHFRQGIKYEQAVADILEAEDRYCDQLSDVLFDDEIDVDDVLKKMGVEVKE